MCSGGGGGGSRPPTPQEERQQRQERVNSLGDKYQRWTDEDMRSTGTLDRINQQVAAAKAENHAKLAKEAEAMRQQQTARSSGRPNVGSYLSIGFNPQNTFNEAEMRQDLINRWRLERVESGVYNRPTPNATNDAVGSKQVSVAGGGAGKGRRPGTSGSARPGGGAPPTGAAGVKLNIGS